MIYYKNLFKNKKYLTILINLLFVILGVIAFIVNFLEVINEGIKYSGVTPAVISESGLIGIISMSNIGMIIIGILFIYIGLIYLPRNANGSQNDEDYVVENRDKKIYIKFKKYEFLLDKDNFIPNKLFFRDMNKKFVPMVTGYQIYNYIMIKYKDFFDKKTD